VSTAKSFHILSSANSSARYVKDILKNTSRSVDQVTIQPNGKWELHARPEPTSKLNGVASSDDDDDLVEITKSGDSIRMGTPRAYGIPAGGATPSTHQALSALAAPRSTGTGTTNAKRPITAVIDLTSSGDEDDEPFARQPKRQYTNGGTNGFAAASTPAYRPGPSNGYQSRT
jgi:E3 SUMO-protein ligase PIAS1